ncbi:hydantoinase B/oxoprolinase family protein [Siccirubricoccus phaeus]|uniref:hydantoinase B/oxoprolinase family protein n=1 Tax=Siccirubricoccus phaeus TaxID=2595053 RepID=UPI0011F3EBFD|nr:hydantoinase B/oxoprolinase family protein [Siccirubricoccus phaeus]
MAVDPITLEVLTQGLISIVREMRATVMRTAKSVAIYEAKDFSCGLFAPGSQVVAQSNDIGSHVVPMPWSVRAAMAKLGETLAPGDVLLMNDPYAGGTHLNDVTIIVPAFREGRLAFFPAVRAHWPDVGGMVPGSMSGKATEIYQEGIRIPPMKVMEAGRLNAPVLELLLANMRVPEERQGDFDAMLAACRVAEARIQEMLARYGIALVEEAVRLDLDRSEARMRATIASLPDGTYHYEDYLETFPDGRFEPLLVPLALTIAGDRMIADFTGAAPQVPVPVNSTLAVTAGSVFIAVKSVLDPALPLNQGSFRSIEVIAPAGTVLNVERPAPAGSHGEVRKRVIATMVGALSQVTPERVAGDLCRTSFHNLIGGWDPASRREWVHYEWSGGGNGAFREGDGPSAMAPFDWGDLVTVQPSEVLETRFPLLVEESRLRTDSGGAGTTRGGLAMQRRIRLLAAEGRYSLLSDGAVVPAFGVLGGRSGLPVASWVEKADGGVEAFDTPGKVGGHLLRRGDAVVLRSAGGGGYGDPLQRPPAAVAEDVRLGLISPEAAAAFYGVVLTAEGSADLPATEARRTALYAARQPLAAAAATQDSVFEAGSVSRRRLCRLHPADAAARGLTEDLLVEMDTGEAAALRGWIRIDPTVPQGRLPLDPIGLGILKAKPGGAVALRAVQALPA